MPEGKHGRLVIEVDVNNKVSYTVSRIERPEGVIEFAVPVFVQLEQTEESWRYWGTNMFDLNVQGEGIFATIKAWENLVVRHWKEMGAIVAKAEWTK